MKYLPWQALGWHTQSTVWLYTVLAPRILLFTQSFYLSMQIAGQTPAQVWWDYCYDFVCIICAISQSHQIHLQPLSYGHLCQAECVVWLRFIGSSSLFSHCICVFKNKYRTAHMPCYWQDKTSLCCLDKASMLPFILCFTCAFTSSCLYFSCGCSVFNCMHSFISHKNKHVPSPLILW